MRELLHVDEEDSQCEGEILEVKMGARTLAGMEDCSRPIKPRAASLEGIIRGTVHSVLFIASLVPKPSSNTSIHIAPSLNADQT